MNGGHEVSATAIEAQTLQTDSTRAILRTSAIILTITALVGAISLAFDRQPANGVASSATVIGSIITWVQARARKPNAVPVLIAWATLTGLPAIAADSHWSVANAMSLLLVVFLAIFLLEGRPRRGVIIYTWVVWALILWRVADTIADSEAFFGLVLTQFTALAIGTVLMTVLRRRLHGSVSRLAALYHGIPVGVFRVGADGRVWEANATFARLLDLESSDQLIGRDGAEFLVEPSELARLGNAARRGRTAHRGVLEVQSETGRPRWVQATVRPCGEEPGCYEGTLEDVTGQVLAENLAREAETLFTTAFEHAPFGMALLRPDGRFLRVNRALSELVGRTNEDLLAGCWSDLAGDDEEWMGLLAGTWEVDVERPLTRPDGVEVWVRASVSVIDRPSGSYAVAQVADVSSQKTLQDSLEQMVRSKDEFIASVSHELRTPLTAVVGFANLLVDEGRLEPEERAEGQRMVLTQAVSLSHLVDDLLVAARADFDRLSVSPAPLDLDASVRAAVSDCEHWRRQRDSDLRISGTAEAWADPVRVRQVLRNLLINAYRYGGRQVEIQLANGGSRSSVAVIDDGTGIPETEWESIFEPYRRVHVGRTTTESIGLGLAVSKQLAVLMDGDLTYRFDNGRSVFELTLPARSPVGVAD